MGIVEDLLNDKGSELSAGLVEKAGFTAQQASGFLPPALGSVAELLQGGGVDLGALFGSGGTAEVLSKLDVAGLASRAGISESLARGGLEQILPLVLSALQSKAGGAAGLAGLLGGERASGLLGAAGKLFKR